MTNETARLVVILDEETLIGRQVIRDLRVDNGVIVETWIHPDNDRDLYQELINSD